MQHTFFVATIATALLSSSLSVQAQSIRPEPIALPASEFPVPSATLDALITAENFTALRAHAWTLWSGVTADSTQTFKGAVLPIWETWLSEQEVFAPPGATLPRNAAGRVLLPLSRPRQFNHFIGKGTRTAALQSAVAPFGSLLADVKISPDSAAFIQAPHETPAGSGTSYSYESNADLQHLNDNFDQKNTPVADRKIIDFPAAAIDLKVVFLPVKSTGLSAVPVWNGPQDSTLPDQPVPSTWKTCVAVDPTNMRVGKAQIDCNGATIDAQIVPLNAFYSVQLDPVEAVTVNNLAQLSGNAALVGGDYRVLVAMHITSKEIANWTWATFWWQNGNNPPKNFPGSTDGRPDSSKVKGVWRNFAMCISNAMVSPPTDPKGKPIVCFNPYLETAQQDGLNSNCMSCHARATMPGVPYTPTYLPNGWTDLADPQIFGGQTKTDFVWAIQSGAK